MTLRTLLPGPLARALPSLALSSLALLAPPALAQDLRDADVATADVATAEAPPRLTYSGLLTDEAGQPLPDGPRALVFRAYPSAEAARSADAPAWEEAHDAAVVGGRFLVVLGSKAALPAAAGWVTVAVDGAPASTPVRLGQPTDGPVGGAVTGSAGAALAPGNTLQQSYENGRTIDVATGAPLLIRGAPATIGLTVRDITPVFTATQLARFRLSSSSSGRIWEYRVYGSNNEDPGPGYFTIADATGGGADAFQIAPGAGEDVLRLTAGTANVGSPTDPAGFRAYTTPNPSDPEGGVLGFEVRDYDFGAGSSWYDATGESYATFQPDFAGAGGYFRVSATTGTDYAFVVDGNASGGSTVSLPSGVSPSVFNTGVTGTGSVVLPADAISTPEILNEPGAANNINNARVVLSANDNLTLSRTITIPGSGYVLALGTAEALITHATGTTSTIQVSVSRDCDASPTGPLTQQTNIVLPASLPSGLYRQTVTVHGLFQANAAGSTTYCIYGYKASSTNVEFDDQNLTLLYVPTAYGTTVTNLAEAGRPEDESEVAGAPLTAGDIASERAASIRDNQDRIASELAEMQAQIEAMRAQLAGDQDQR